jgi:hypothetical protein
LRTLIYTQGHLRLHPLYSKKHPAGELAEWLKAAVC